MSIGSTLRARLSTKLRRYQVRGVRFIEACNGRALLGDEPGIGKTIQAIGWLALHPEARPAIIVCPATVKWGWRRQFSSHAGLRAQILSAFKAYGVQLRIWKKEKGQGEAREITRWFPTPEASRQFIHKHRQRALVLGTETRAHPRIHRDIVILNYDILQEWMSALVPLQAPFVAFDECHRLRNPKAIRTKVSTKLATQTPYLLGLSGTPILSRPVEFFPFLHMVRPDKFPSLWNYCFRYCGPRRGFGGRWDFRGSSNTKELHEKLSDVMIRRRKADVLPELPPKSRTVIPIDIANQEEYEEARDRFIEWLAKKGRKPTGAVALTKLEALKQLAAAGKLAEEAEWIQDRLDGSQEKLVTFAVHHDIVDALLKLFPKAAVLTGEVPEARRRAVVKRFKTDPECRLFIGNIQAAGEGLDDLQHVASTLAFLELPWTPAELDQSEDRLQRFGQLSAVEAYYFIGRNTVEEDIWALLDEKRTVVGEVLDGGEAPDIPTRVLSLLMKGFQDEVARKKATER